MTTKRTTYADVATIAELQDILDEVTDQYGDDVEVSVPRRDGWCVPTHPKLVVESIGGEEYVTLYLAH